MGTLLYGATKTTIAIDDRALAHVQVVIGAKLRRGETFFFSWVEDPGTGSGRGSIWISANIPLTFVYRDPQQQVPLSRRWVEQLALSANTPQGLFLSDEPVEQPTSVPILPAAGATAAATKQAAAKLAATKAVASTAPVRAPARRPLSRSAVGNP